MSEQYRGTVFEQFKNNEFDYSAVTALYGLINSPYVRLAGGRANEFYGTKNLRRQKATELATRRQPDTSPVDLTEFVNEYNKQSGRPDQAA